MATDLEKFKLDLRRIKNIRNHFSKKMTQKVNWQKYRFNYLKGIHSFLMRHKNSLSNESTILDSAIKERKLTEGQQFDPTCYNKIEKGVKTTMCLKQLQLLNENVDNILSSLNNLEMENNTTSAKNYDGVSIPSVPSVPLIYDFNNPEVTLDTLQAYIEESLKHFKVQSVNVDRDIFMDTNNEAIYIDLIFQNEDPLSFVMYVDPAGDPIMDCQQGTTGKGRSMILPQNYVDIKNRKIVLDPFLIAFPMSFVISCVQKYIHDGGFYDPSTLNESLRLLENTQVLNEVRFRKLIRDGQIAWVRQKPKRLRRKTLPFAQRIALNLARKKAHTNTAETHRKKSLSVGDRMGVYDRVQVKTAPVRKQIK